jgi:hypothetical protein
MTTPSISELRSKYLELTKLFFYEIQKGRSLSELTDIKNSIDEVLLHIKELETKMEEGSNCDETGCAKE